MCCSSVSIRSFCAESSRRGAAKCPSKPFKSKKYNLPAMLTQPAIGSRVHGVHFGRDEQRKSQLIRGENERYVAVSRMRVLTFSEGITENVRLITGYHASSNDASGPCIYGVFFSPPTYKPQSVGGLFCSLLIYILTRFFHHRKWNVNTIQK